MEVRSGYDAERAPKIIDEFGPETALIDIGLPGMGGYASRGASGQTTVKLPSLRRPDGSETKIARKENKPELLAGVFCRQKVKPKVKP